MRRLNWFQHHWWYKQLAESWEVTAKSHNGFTRQTNTCCVVRDIPVGGIYKKCVAILRDAYEILTLLYFFNNIKIHNKSKEFSRKSKPHELMGTWGLCTVLQKAGTYAQLPHCLTYPNTSHLAAFWHSCLGQRLGERTAEEMIFSPWEVWWEQT